EENKATNHGVSTRRKSLRSSWRGTGYTSRGGGTGRRRRSTNATTIAIAINASAIPMRTAMASMYRRPSRRPPSCKNPAVADTAGYLADRWHRTRTIGHTVVAWSGITMLTAASQNFGQLIAGRALLGFGQAITEPSANSLISDYYPTEQRGSAFSVQQIMGIIGFGVGIALGGAIGSQYGWHWAFIVVGPPG